MSFRLILTALVLFTGTVAATADPIVLRRGNTAEPDTLDPHKWSLTYEEEIMDDMFLGLMQLDAKAEPIPGAADSHVVSSDGMVWTFKLHDGATWSDGVPVTAEDFVAGIRRAMEPKTASPTAEFGYLIKNAAAVNKSGAPIESLGVRAIDDKTLEITLERPSPLLLQISALPNLFPLPRHVYEKHGEQWIKAGNVVSNGPYVLEEWRPNDYVHLVKNPLFFEASTVQINEVYFYPTDDDTAALRRFRAGELDMNWRFPQAQYDWLKANMPESTFVAPANWINYVILNQKNPKFADVRVRRALSMAIDRDALVRVTKTGEIPAYRVVPTAIEGYTEKTGLDFRAMAMPNRLSEARGLLEAAGYSQGNPLRFVMRHRAGDVNRRIAVSLQEAWRSIGVEVELSASDVKSHYAALRARDFEVGDAGYSQWPDPEFFMWLLISNRLELNYGDYSNPEFDRLAAEAAATLDRTERFNKFAEAEDIALKDNGIIPLFFFSSRNLVAPYVKGFRTNGPDNHPTRWLRIER
jgi:oligopeptide transport system substrate-binding protein